MAVPKPPYGLSPRSILLGTPALNMRLFPSSKFTCGKVSFLGLNDGASQSLNFGGTGTGMDTHPSPLTWGEEIAAVCFSLPALFS